MTGLSKYEDKEKRAMRRRNHIARDLANSKFRQRVIPNKKRKAKEAEEDYDA